MSGRSPGRALAGAPCICLLQRCLAVHLKKVGPLGRSSPTTTTSDHQPQQFWMYDSGYLVFQGFLEANQKCFWNASLLEAVRVLEFQGYVAPGVLLVRANPCALEVIRSAWARNVLKAPANYSITSVGDVEDCLVQTVSQGQFTPLAEALCWVVLDLTASGQAAMLETIRAALHQTFPEMERPTRNLVYDTLAQLMADRKLYQSSKGYFVVTPEWRRLRQTSPPEASSTRTMLMSTDEAVALVHGEMETVPAGERTHQAVQTCLADVILGGNPNDKILYARSPAKRAQLERRHSLRLFGSNKRLAALQRSGSMKHIPSRQISADSTLTTNSLASSSTFSRKSWSLLSRIFRRSKRGKSQPLQTFSAQFPPSEWFNSRVRHLHSVGTQTQSVRHNRSNSPSASSNRSRTNSSSRSHLVDRGWTERESETLPRHHRTPTPSRPPSRRSSPHPSPHSAPSTSPSRSSLSSNKTVVNTKCMSSASSGYNSLPRSSKSPKTSRQSSATPTPKNSPIHSTTNSGKNSITLQVSTNQNKGNYSSQCDTNIGGFISSLKSSLGEATDDNSTTMTTTINGNNTTKIFVQQQSSPVRSIITFENGLGKTSPNPDLIILNGAKPSDSNKSNEKDGNCKIKSRSKVERPSSLYAKEEKEDRTKEKIFGQLETQMKMKFPSSETIQLEEKLLTSSKNNKNNQKMAVYDSTKLATGSLIDVTNLESELNNVRKASISSIPLHAYNKTENLSVKNLLKDIDRPFLPLIMNKEVKNFKSNPPSPTKAFPGEVSSSNGSVYNMDHTKVGDQVSSGKKEENQDLATFPSLSDLSLHFTSLAAQNILKGVSINSIDTLVEVNMAAEKQNNREMTKHTDFGMV